MQDTAQDRTKREFMAEWIDAVNEHGGFGEWVAEVSFSPADVADLLGKHVPTAVSD